MHLKRSQDFKREGGVCWLLGKVTQLFGGFLIQDFRLFTCGVDVV